MEIPKEYNAKEIESELLEKWDNSIYYFDWNSEKPQYIIDTPPPYPTGDFHIGNALNWCYIDFIARYKRMRGYNVMFPQGWDCHGLPTEVKVEEIYNITKNQVPRNEFRKYCEKLTAKNIKKMKKTLKRLGFSIDWSNEYITMDPEYYGKTQISFIKMYNNKLIYREDHPVNWCPRCETAIAYAEVEYSDRETTLNYLLFNSKLKIATTRPELLAACVAVAVNPKDERYKDYIGKEVKVPIFNHKVKIFADDEVDPEFGTGVVMICTFGDKQDVRWWKGYNLPLRKAIDRNGKMTSLANKYEGMSVEECKNAIIEDLKNSGILYKQKKIDQSVGLCWRCKTPIEILSERQWFVKIDPDKIMQLSQEIEWVPPHMEIRLKNWTGTMEWDWCISRQRIFATPIPVWYCKQCGETIVANLEDIPVDPTQSNPSKACSCGSNQWLPEEDVLDTWMDSSISALHAAGWLKDWNKIKNPSHIEQKATRLPSQLRLQGHDIIRTWAFYTILRSEALTGLKPWDTIIINGMVLGEDGHKMSKSRGNIISPETVIEQYGADAFRQWAAIGGATGSDIMFRWKDVVSASRFQQKLWSIFRFSKMHLVSLKGNKNGNWYEINAEDVNLTTIDKWLLSKLNKLVQYATEKMESYQFDEVFKAIRGFTWENLADNYIEIAKSRLYGKNLSAKRAAQYTLYTTLKTISKLIAPFTPFIAEKIYSELVAYKQSVHTQSWPKVDEELISDKEEEKGELIKEIVSAIRRYKSERGIALNAPLNKIEIYARLTEIEDIAGATNTEVELLSSKSRIEKKPVAINPKLSIIGPKFRDKSKKIIKAIKSANPAKIAKQAETGSISLEIDKEKIEIPAESVSIEREIISKGRSVDLIELDKALIMIIKDQKVYIE